METTRYSAPLDLKSKIAVNRKLSVLANLRYYNLASCSIIDTEETEQEEYPQEFLRVHHKTRNEFPTSFFVPEDCRYFTRFLCPAVLGHGSRKTWELAPQLQPQILHFRPFSYHLHAMVILNSTPLCEQPFCQPPATVYLAAYINYALCLSNISSTFFTRPYKRLSFKTILYKRSCVTLLLAIFGYEIKLK